MANLTIRIDDDLKQRLRAQAARNGRSMTEEVRQMLREALFIEPPKAKTCRILADTAASLADFKKDPIGTLHECSGETVVILDHNAPVFYAVPTERYEAMLQMIDDTRLAEAIRRRQDEPTVRADIDDSIAKAGKAD
ncbi:FitA-like ribbon-helix-helix domain-containing protein [Ectopseudomonas chengduensis]|jgi:antitoxin StbD|nr:MULTISPECIES: ribbon-helix-helix protein, CopG family [Pseudomonas]MDH0959366.1 ribbon-helix-helix protein, CopG family [Pseudomonas chengduensis]MDH1535674.1 ribbon-helix-helix protein, CopG family [Pseudomonas chengduensis]